MKTCSSCGETKPLHLFYRDKNEKDGRRYECKMCRAKYERTRTRVIDPSKVREQHLRLTYGISSDRYEELFIEQDGKCAICRRPQLEFTRRFHVDHDHETGAVRGLLCVSCNTFLGKITANPELIESSLKYLEKWS